VKRSIASMEKIASSVLLKLFTISNEIWQTTSINWCLVPHHTCTITMESGRFFLKPWIVRKRKVMWNMALRPLIYSNRKQQIKQWLISWKEQLACSNDSIGYWFGVCITCSVIEFRLKHASWQYVMIEIWQSTENKAQKHAQKKTFK